jgi:hypothetical protein
MKVWWKKRQKGDGRGKEETEERPKDQQRKKKE